MKTVRISLISLFITFFDKKILGFLFSTKIALPEE